MPAHRPLHQVTLKRLAGAESWVLVMNGAKAFRLPLSAPIEELMMGIEGRWSEMHKPSHTEMYIRIPLALYRDLTRDGIQPPS
jgi:hypothetical protein